MDNLTDSTLRAAGQPDSLRDRQWSRPPRGGLAARKLWPVLVSVLLGVLLIPAIAYGLISDSAYRGYGQNLILASRAQDLLTALVIPVLVWASVQSKRGSLAAHLLWLGLLFYLGYSYAIYLIGWQQNRVFLIYVLVVLLATAALVDGVTRVEPSAVRPAVRVFRTTGLGWFLVVVGVAFTGLWLTDIAPSAWAGGHRSTWVLVGRRTPSTSWISPWHYPRSSRPGFCCSVAIQWRSCWPVSSWSRSPPCSPRCGWAC